MGTGDSLAGVEKEGSLKSSVKSRSSMSAEKAAGVLSTLFAGDGTRRTGLEGGALSGSVMLVGGRWTTVGLVVVRLVLVGEAEAEAFSKGGRFAGDVGPARSLAMFAAVCGGCAGGRAGGCADGCAGGCAVASRRLRTSRGRPAWSWATLAGLVEGNGAT